MAPKRKTCRWIARRRVVVHQLERIWYWHSWYDRVVRELLISTDTYVDRIHQFTGTWWDMRRRKHRIKRTDLYQSNSEFNLMLGIRFIRGRYTEAFILSPNPVHEERAKFQWTACLTRQHKWNRMKWEIFLPFSVSRSDSAVHPSPTESSTTFWQSARLQNTRFRWGVYWVIDCVDNGRDKLTPEPLYEALDRFFLFHLFHLMEW